MKTNVISLYDNYKCLMDKCPSTCCRGWRIPIDEGTYEKYQNAPDYIRKKLMSSVSTNDILHLKTPFGKCPNETKEGLCQMELDGMQEYMPMICRTFPRRCLLFDDVMEVTLELTCPKVAELFMENLGRLYFKDAPKDDAIEPSWEMKNSDPKFYELLVNQREEILDFLWQETEWEKPYLPSQCAVIFEYIKKLHALIIRDRLDEASDFHIDQFYESESDIDIYNANQNDYRYMYFGMDIFDEIFSKVVDDETLFARNKTLLKLTKRYYYYFDKKTAAEANDFCQRNIVDMLETNPSLETKYRNYLSYHLQQTFTSAFLDYHVLKPVILGLVYLQTLIMADFLDYMDGSGLLEQDRQTEVLMSVEKRMRHNAAIPEKVLQIIRKKVDLL